MRHCIRILVLLLACVLIPCVVVFSIINYITLSQYQKSVSDSQINRLQAVNGINQLIIENMEQSALRFSIEPTVQSLDSVINLNAALTDSSHVRNLKRTQDMLAEMVLADGLFHSAYFYLNNSDYVVSSQGNCIKIDRFADMDWMPRYRQLQENRKFNRMIPSRPIITGYRDRSGTINYGKPCLTYVYPITPFTSSFEGALIFNIYEDKLLELYAEPSSGGNIALFDENGNWLTGVKSLDRESLLINVDWNTLINRKKPRKGYFIQSRKDISYQYTYFRSADERFVIIGFENISDIMEKTTQIQFLFVIFLFFFIPFIAFMIVILSRRLYSPITQLVQELSARGKLDMNIKQDAMTAISKAVQDLLREDQRIFSDSNKKKLRNAAFLRILSEDIGQDDEDVQEIVPYDYCICILASVDIQEAEEQQDSNFDTRMRLLLRLIEQSLTTQNTQATALRYEGNKIVALYSFQNQTNNLEHNLHTQLAALQSEARTVMDCTVTFAIGSLKDSDGIRKSFEQAKGTLEYRFVFGTESILFYDHTATCTEHFDADKMVKNIRQYLQLGKKNELLQEIDALIDEIHGRRNVSFTCVSMILNQLATILAEYVMVHRIDLEDLLADQVAIYRQLWQNLTLEDAKQWIKVMVSAVMDYRQIVETPSGSKYIREIITYVKKHYCEDITIHNIATHIGISYSHMRKLFKDATGRNLADYINSLRINKAKKLLMHCNYTIREIASMCGYNHERSFSRAFTQSEGMSPKKYKDSIRLQHID